jgi:protein phosphatase
MGGGHQNVCPYFAAVPIQAGDRFLICSDGLIDGVWERHIASAMGGFDRPKTAVENLLKRAIDNSGIDDTTLIVICVAERAKSEHASCDANDSQIGTENALSSAGSSDLME